ncbi:MULTISPECIES: ribonuclease III [unclassified Lentimonas]|uniref:ribonuclease III n=1 Tax=unclassified Lentimonas TaxID=2630993 RepID=UPI001329AEB9|nr:MULTISPECIES: ribonuclease III [unclassified Lentimonas]CAA6690743.1 Ribonuclease III (EC [Lentimonas sp. CC19]CAA6693324.1 Ribonuclease III (EC [Lentimonas sp. CC10]CAA7071804.1 Ribonuclease III (EC [Lentimonas sp. CC11]
MPHPLNPFEKQIGYQFSDVNLLELALTHPSCDTETGDNQRLEFLGDAVLDLVIAEALYKDNPDLHEGALDHMRAGLVNGKALTAHARTIGLDDALQVSDAQRQHHSDPSAAMLEDALEALIGAIYLDGKIDAARTFILRTFGRAIAAAPKSGGAGNPKGRLQEWTQQQYSGAVPDYIALADEGPDHARLYSAAVQIDGKELGRGQGSSKKAAETAAAAHALQQING